MSAFRIPSARSRKTQKTEAVLPDDKEEDKQEDDPDDPSARPRKKPKTEADAKEEDKKEDDLEDAEEGDAEIAAEKPAIPDPASASAAEKQTDAAGAVLDMDENLGQRAT